MKKWVCRLSIVCCLCLFFTSVKAQLSLGGLGDILNSSTVNKVLTTIASKSQSSTLKSVGGLLDEYEGVLMGFELVK